MGEIYEDGHAILPYDESFREIYWTQLSEYLREKYSDQDFSNLELTETILKDAFQFLADKFKEIILHETSFSFYLLAFNLHEESFKLYFKTLEGYKFVEIQENEFALYRRILKLVLEQGCDIMHHLEHPTCGVLGMQDMLFIKGFTVNHKRIRRLMRLMNIRAKYPQKHLSDPGPRKYIQPYLLRGLDINRVNQVCSIDISYIPMKQGFMYLCAIIDVRSRFIVGWNLSNTLDKSVCIDLVEESIRKHGSPEILNSDQGSQFTSARWIELLKKNKIQISIDGKGRAKDNIWIERFWRTIKQEYVYLNPCNDGLELYKGIREYMQYYNYNRAHKE